MVFVRMHLEQLQLQVSRLLPAMLMFAFASLLALLAPSAQSQEEAVAFFENKIRPILVEHCYECHSTDSSPIQGGLLVDSPESLRQGGDSGAAVVPGNPAESLILSALRYETSQMPPSGKLPPEVIANFHQWIEQGAIDPREPKSEPPKKLQVDFAKASQHWSYQPIADVPIPPSVDPWSTSVIDRFVFSKLQATGLQPSMEADRFTLLRRVYFDLIGLTPTPAEVESFVADQDPNAFEKVVDRLLASPHYGERWGRHWLDLARYADSNGADENHAYPVAWRYRDYVVDAWNRDLPFDRFITEQIAGDLLPYSNEQERRDQLTATGFLVIGPKMLAEQDKPKLVADLVDEQLDTVGLTFMGMTLGCARCHDHKFDPISQRDYYALAGVFHSTKSMANLDFVSQWNERELPDANVQTQIESHRERIAQTQARTTKLEEQLKTTEAQLQTPLTDEEKNRIKTLQEQTRVELEAAKKELEELNKSLPKLPTAMGADEANTKEVPIHIRGNHLQLDKEIIQRGFPKLFEEELQAPAMPPKQSGRLELAQWLTDAKHPLVARVAVNRIWKGHFGEGLVRSVSNFGLQGDAPTHPELLDWLATRLITAQWSIKQMHREICLTKTYRMSSGRSAVGEAIDPDNRFLWRQNRRRLEAEPLRDSLVCLSGDLDRKLGGQAESIYGATYEQEGGGGKGVNDALRRAIYLPINRAALFDFFATFDYVDSAVSVGKRPTTTVPHQALFLMNNPLALQQARKLAERVIREASSERERLNRLFLIALSRPPHDREIEIANRFLQGEFEATATEAAKWGALAQAILATNEFVYVD